MRRFIVTAAASASLFVLGVVLSLALSARDTPFLTFWLPSGVVLAYLIRSPLARWPAIVTGSLLANVASEYGAAGRALGPALGFAVSNALEALSGAVLIHLLGGLPSLDRIVHVLRLVVSALLVAALPGALVGAVVARTQYDVGFVASWMMWWMSDVVGILLVTPAAFITRDEWRDFWNRLRSWRGLEAGAAFMALVAATTAVYWLPPHPVRGNFMLLPFLMWTTFRFGGPGLLIGVGTMSTIAIRGTLAGHGAFAELPHDEALFATQLFISVGAVFFLLFAATLRERESSMLQLRRQEQDARVRHFADTAPAILWAADLDGQRTFLSRGWMELTGEPAAHGLGGGWLQTVHPDDRERVAATATDATRQRCGYQVRYRVRSASGEYRWVMSAGRPQPDEHGEIVGYVGSLIDVHEQATAASALARADALLDAVFQSAPVGLAFLDRDLRFQRINERLAAINGLPIEAHTGHTPAELLPGIDDMSELMSGFRDVVYRGQPKLGVEVAGETPATPGVRHWWRENFFPVSVAGEVVGMGVVAEDITEQKRTEQALRESEARFRKLAEEGPVIVWVTAGARLQYLSPRWSEYTGAWGDAATEVAIVLEAVHPDDREQMRREWFASEPGSAFETEFRLRGLDGQHRWFLSRGVAMPADAHGVQRVGAYVDIHDRKVAERELLESARRKDEFLAMLAHELRNPLAPIQNAVRLIEVAAPGSPAQTAAREIIARQLSHIVRLVDDLLDISRLSRGKLSIRREPTDLAAVLRETATDLRPSFEERQLTLDVDLPDSEVWTDGDRIRLAQMIGNLLHNAQKFTPAGGTVRLRLTVDDSRQAAVIAVQDTGIGMTPDLIAQVFDEFSQGTQTLDRTPGGLGLGLALVRRFAELHGGSAEASSPGAGQGSTFTVHLPLRPATHAARPAATAVSARDSST